jgi:superfamily II DNA/RNA helicase
MPAKERRQTLLFSATFPQAMQTMAANFLRVNYTWIGVGRVGSTTASIRQVVLMANRGRLVRMRLYIYVIIEC